MALKSAKGYYGLQGIFDLTSVGVTGEAIVGPGSSNVALPTTGQAWAVNIEVDGALGEVAINLGTGAVTITDASVAQVETATAVGSITTTGNATVTVTGDDITGSPLAISVAVLNTDTAATWAGKVRTALAVAAIASKYTVGGASASITLTRITKRKNDATLNIALANGTCTGITAAPTSANTTAGVAFTKCERLVGTTFGSDDAEGKALTGGNPYGLLIQVAAGVNRCNFVHQGGETSIGAEEILLRLSPTNTIAEGPVSFVATEGYTKATFSVITA